MTFVDLPPPAEIGADIKKAIIGGLRRAIDVYRREGILQGEGDYQSILHDPSALRAFIGLYRQNPLQLDDIVKTAKGKPPASDDEPLTCGVSLAQVQQLLIRTCAKRVYEKETPEEEPEGDAGGRRFPFFAREPEKKADDQQERKNRLIIENLAFDWQLPLLGVYQEVLSPQQLVALGGDLAAMRSPEAVRAAAALDPTVLRKARQSAGREVQLALADRPESIAGISYMNREMYVFFRKVLGDQAFRFFTRDRQFFNQVASLEKAMVRVYGDVLCYIAPENLDEMERLSVDKTDVLLTALRETLGDALEPALASPAFARDVLRKLVEGLVHMRQEKDAMHAKVLVICQVLAPQVRDWLKRQHAAKKAGGRA